MADGVRVAEAAGAHIIDINMGCPAKRVTNGYAGSALMREPDLALRIVEATVEAATVPVTLKMRLGWDDASLNAADLARTRRGCRRPARHRARPHALPVLQGRGRLACHPPRQGSVTIPVVANGDLVRAEDAPAMLAAPAPTR